MLLVSESCAKQSR